MKLKIVCCNCGYNKTFIGLDAFEICYQIEQQGWFNNDGICFECFQKAYPQADPLSEGKLDEIEFSNANIVLNALVELKLAFPDWHDRIGFSLYEIVAHASPTGLTVIRAEEGMRALLLHGMASCSQPWRDDPFIPPARFTLFH